MFRPGITRNIAERLGNVPREDISNMLVDVYKIRFRHVVNEVKYRLAHVAS